ncbi:MAG: hypothetical protein HY431_01175 [Candidatus Levybacteria bacterium]|nr:hypothetical protein [Candidatus Levybacteria bacterium]
MVKRKSTCGLCKPHKKWEKNNTKAKEIVRIEILQEALMFHSTGFR